MAGSMKSEQQQTVNCGFERSIRRRFQKNENRWRRAANEIKNVTPVAVGPAFGVAVEDIQPRRDSGSAFPSQAGCATHGSRRCPSSRLQSGYGGSLRPHTKVRL